MHTQGASFNFGEYPFECPPNVPYTAVLHAAQGPGPKSCTPILIPDEEPSNAGEAAAFILTHLDRLAHTPPPGKGEEENQNLTLSISISLRLSLGLTLSPTLNPNPKS